jgi:hypothetical protein
MFRYAALMLLELSRPSNRKVTTILANMPTGLNGMYHLILRRLDPTYAELRKTILTWMTLAKRPIRVPEIAYAFAAGDSEEEFDPDDMIMIGREDILLACGCLVEIFNDDELRFTHFSIKEFLLQPPE